MWVWGMYETVQFLVLFPDFWICHILLIASVELIYFVFKSFGVGHHFVRALLLLVIRNFSLLNSVDVVKQALVAVWENGLTIAHTTNKNDSLLM